MKPIKYQLKNGLQVILVPSLKNPVISIQAWVRTGSADETPKEAGISHFIEHLLFKGTDKFKVGEIASTIEGHGGELNAYTSFDQTVFHVTLPSEKRDVGLDVISQMMGYPQFDPQEIDREREVVIEEIKRGQDSAGRVHSQLMFSQMFTKHTYGRPIIGFEKNIKEVSVKTIRKYFQERYTPRNMFLVISGDFEIKELKKEIEKYFGLISSAPLRKVKRPTQKKAAGKIKVLKTNFKESHVSISWMVPSVQHKDIPALDVLALILGQGDSSRLAKRLRFDKALCLGVGASSYSLIDHGIFSFSATIQEEDAAEFFEAMSEELNKFFASGPSASELTKAVTSLSSDTIYSFETVDGVSRSFGSMEFYFKKPTAFEEYLKSIQKLKREDVVRVAQKYLKKETMICTAIVEKNPSAMNKNFLNFKKNFFNVKTKLQKEKKEKSIQWPKIKTGSNKLEEVRHIHTIQLPGGGKLLLKRQNETPTTALRLAFGGGLFIEENGKEGLSELLSRTWSGGSKKYSESEINEKIESMAAGFGTFSGRNTLGVSAYYVSSFEEKIWDLVESVVLEPTLPEEVFLREKQILLQQVNMKKDHPSHLCIRGFTEKFYGNHPYAKDPSGTVESLSKLTIDDVVKQKNKALTQENFSVAIVGDIHFEKWIDRIEKLEKTLKRGSQGLIKKSFAPPQEDIRFKQNLKKEQAHLLIGMQAYSIDDPKRWTLHVLQSVLAGQGGRLFIELRDKESLAYTVSPVSLEGYGVGSFGVYIGCSPEKTKKAEELILKELNKLMNEKIPQAELDRAVEYLRGRGQIDLQRKSSITSSILFDSIYGNNPEEGLHPEKHYKKVSAEDLQNVARELFTQKKVVSIVGPEEVT